MMSVLKLGYNEISSDDYHADREYVSSSGLKLYLKCPREFYQKYVKQKEGTEIEDEEGTKSAALIFGSLVHTSILEPHLLQEEYSIYDGASKRGKAYEDFAAAQGTKTVITSSQMSHADMLKSVFEENKHAVALIKDGDPEKTLCVEMDGIKIKVRADYLQGEKIIDLKTTANGVTYNEVQRAIIQWDYALSAALYVDAFTQFTGKKHDFYFVFLGKSPMGCEVYKASEALLEHGRKKYKNAITKINQSRASGSWFNEGIQEIDLEGFV